MNDFAKRFDTEKITEIVEAASSPKEAFENLHAFYPELEVEALQKQCDFVQGQVEAALKEQKKNEVVELTEEELENVAGGGWFSDVGNWFKDNWKKVAIGAAIVVGTALVATGIGAGVGAAITYFTSQAALSAMGASLSYSTFALAAGYTCTPILTGTGAAIGAAVGTAVGGAVTGALAGTGNLPG